MRPFRLFAAILCLFAVTAFAQDDPSLTFTAENTSANGRITPVLSWSTAPAADSCVAAGDWSGEKGPSGTETLAETVVSQTFELTCTWLADNDVRLSWDNPTQRTDGSPYTNPGHSLIEYSPDGQPPFFMAVAPAGATSFVIEDLEPGDWFFQVRAVDSNDLMSEPSGMVSKTVPANEEHTETLRITVNSIPLPPTNLTAE